MKLIKSSNINYNIKDVQEKVLYDIDHSGKRIDWHEKKLKSLELAKSYKRLGQSYINKSIRVKECGTYLEYKKFTDLTMKLHQANFCKVRLCPMCSWRRSLKIYGQVSKIMDHISKDKDYEFIFLTLTHKNCTGEELTASIDQLINGFNKMTRRARYKQSIKGHFRALEVTHNLINDTYHPHIHVILAVNKSYFTSRDYITQGEWVLLWQSALGVEYNPILDIRKFKAIDGRPLAKSIAEVAKYTVKSDDYITQDKETTDKAVLLLDQALAHRRLTAFGGVLKEIHQLLNLDDQEEGDLINTDNEDLREDIDYIIETYHWHVGYKQYLQK